MAFWFRMSILLGAFVKASSVFGQRCWGHSSSLSLEEPNSQLRTERPGLRNDGVTLAYPQINQSIVRLNVNIHSHTYQMCVKGIRVTVSISFGYSCFSSSTRNPQPSNPTLLLERRALLGPSLASDTIRTYVPTYLHVDNAHISNLSPT